jgi:hypothetical protein
MRPAHTIDTLLSKTKQNGDCLEFTGALSDLGYGKVGYKGKVYMAHRLAYQLKNGGIPTGAVICHKCDNPACINPEHLFVGTHKDNIQDMIQKGRRKGRTRKDVCVNGHEMSGDNVYIYKTDKYNIRQCKACKKTRTKIN